MKYFLTVFLTAIVTNIAVGQQASGTVDELFGVAAPDTTACPVSRSDNFDFSVNCLISSSDEAKENRIIVIATSGVLYAFLKGELGGVDVLAPVGIAWVAYDPKEFWSRFRPDKKENIPWLMGAAMVVTTFLNFDQIVK